MSTQRTTQKPWQPTVNLSYFLSRASVKKKYLKFQLGCKGGGYGWGPRRKGKRSSLFKIKINPPGLRGRNIIDLIWMPLSSALLHTVPPICCGSPYFQSFAQLSSDNYRPAIKKIPLLNSWALSTAWAPTAKYVITRYKILECKILFPDIAPCIHNLL